ncbi:uncharacterized protein LOC133815421 [Humulus lupulus]|uniref:uncharacterized protein LOC133815421 n=1 Tax=Humulus lupulus TaxID=3486 RepID=UPI002B407FDC|nr:uncharacterized protein LOC133815421 [Humulus lupulus]
MVSHLFFAGDNIMFLEATKEECECLKQISRVYSKATGQVVNYNKLEPCFGSKMDPQTHASLTEIFEVKTTDHFEKYLGMPCFIGRKKKDIFKHTKDRIWKKLKG